MTIWNVRVTIAELATNSLSERAMMQYYLASLVFSLIVFEFQFWLGPDRNWDVWVDFAANLLVLIWGVDHCWRSNGATSGRDFIKRVVCLSVPVGVWITIISFIAGILHYAFATTLFNGNYFANPEQANRIVSFLLYTGLAVYFWRWLAASIRGVAEMNP